MLETMKRILTMAGKYRHKVTIGIIISLLHSFFSAMDLFAILYISFSINTLTQQKIGVAAAILLVGLTGKIICKYQITEHISGSSYDVFYEKRLEAGEKLKRVPMGYFSEKNLGEIQMAMTTDMNALESSAMSVVENILGSLIYAAVCTLVLLLFNWRIGLITLAGLGIGILLLRVVQENAKKVMPVRFQAQEEMTEKTLEFIQGNMVMRLFGTGRDGLNRVKEAFHKKQEADIRLENTAVWPISFYRYIFRLASCGVVLIAALLYGKQQTESQRLGEHRHFFGTVYGDLNDCYDSRWNCTNSMVDLARYCGAFRRSIFYTFDDQGSEARRSIDSCNYYWAFVFCNR